MKGKKSIEHPGVIEDISNGIVRVNIMAQSACASCHAKGACSVGDMENKLVEITNNNDSFSVGENVTVSLEQSLGYKALFFGYVFPFLILFIVLIIGNTAGLSEGKAGLLSIAILPVYYTVLYFLKDKMKRVFSFSIHKIV